MKKVFLLVYVMLATVLSFAQETKKVAILEVVDREGKVSYANKLILRSNLAKAITNTPGYEAYDRTDMDAILGEQNFQRTGMVSNEQIKRLGIMTGAKYVLVAEAVMIDVNNMYITAKLLDVETARTEMTDNQLMGTSPKEIQDGCQLMAKNLIKTSTPPSDSFSEYIKKNGKNEYQRNGIRMDAEAYEIFIYKNCQQAWRQYKSGKNAIIAGWVLFGAGCPLAIIGMGLGFGPNTAEASLLIGIPGTIMAGTGAITLCAGYPLKENSYKTYNKICASATLVTLNLTSGPNGLGLALRF